MTSQIATKNWVDTIDDPVIAEAIVDRLFHNAHKILLNPKRDQESYRKIITKKREEESMKKQTLEKNKLHR